MPILVKTTIEQASTEWAILEMQGNLEMREIDGHNSSMADQYIGDLYFDKHGMPILVMGHHVLQGEEIELSKPFAVLEKSRSAEGEHLLQNNENTSNFGSQLNQSVLNATSGAERTILDSTLAIENKSRQRTEYTVRGICSKKLVFKMRPKPIIANLPKKI